MGGAQPPKPPVHVGPVSVPSANHGNQVAAHAAIKNAAEGLQQALLQMPMGGEEHTKLLKIVKELAGMTAESAPDPHAQMQNLVAMARQASQRGGPPGLPQAPAMPQPPAPADAGAQAA
jgi:hypothetical protein